MTNRLYALHIPVKGYWNVSPFNGVGWTSNPNDATLFSQDVVNAFDKGTHDKHLFAKLNYDPSYRWVYVKDAE